eukprot:scaffold168717_cov21-Tisochrysis_lutea.AAC.1
MQAAQRKLKIKEGRGQATGKRAEERRAGCRRRNSGDLEEGEQEEEQEPDQGAVGHRGHAPN